MKERYRGPRKEGTQNPSSPWPPLLSLNITLKDLMLRTKIIMFNKCFSKYPMLHISILLTMHSSSSEIDNEGTGNVHNETQFISEQVSAEGSLL